jgi:hypothetical protein
MGQRPRQMDSPLIESLNTSLPKFLLVMLMTLFPSSIEGLMGLWEEQPSSLLSFKGLEFGNESPPSGGTPTPPMLYSSESGSLSHSTAHQMRDVNPNRWWER